MNKKNFLYVTIFSGLFIFFSFSLFNYRSSGLNDIQNPSTTSIKIQDDFTGIYKQYRSNEITSQLLDKMSLQEKVGQMFMVSVSGVEVNENTKSLIEEYKIGGIAFLGSNIQSPEQLSTFTSQINDLADIEPLIAADQESSNVKRLSWDPSLPAQVTTESMEARADILKAAGVNTNLAPVADVPFVSGSFMKNRVMGTSLEEVLNKSTILFEAHDKNKILTVAKHFPGHGRTTTDSHSELPIIDISKDELMNNDILPFKNLSDKGIPAIMTGHLLLPKIDSRPATISKIFQTDILRNEIGFEGLIISDDMNMGGIKDNPDRFYEAIMAGTDMIIYVQSYPQQISQIQELVTRAENDPELNTKITEANRRILLTKCYYEILVECKN